ncbi:MAG: fatty acid desaturase, partial [Kofleriaceae bacterium]|nr:fatty acid desaturase [Kofleriaceae bacterium]
SAAFQLLPLWSLALLSTVSTVLAFTPMHDASHKSAAKSKPINEVLGRLMALPLAAPFPAFRYLHLEHHKHTNNTKSDPDMWSGTGPRLLLPLRWITQDYYYYFFYLRSQNRAKLEVLEVVSTLVLIYGCAIALAFNGYATEVFVVWFIPGRVALGFLAFSFDYLPHHPHTVLSKDDRYQATVVRESRWLTPLLQYQNYHLVHHLYPGVPFYRYGRVWWAKRAELIEKGARVL